MRDALDPFFQHDFGVVVRARMRDHADAHALETSAVAAAGDDVDDLVVRHGRPVDADEITVGVIALRFAMTREPAISAVGAAALRIGEQQIEAVRAVGAMHVAGHDAERDRRRGRHLHILRGAHVGRQDIVAGQVDALRSHVLRFDPAAVASVRRHRAWGARPHGLGVVERALRSRRENPEPDCGAFRDSS